MAIIDTVDAREDVAVLFLSYLGRAPEYQAMNYYVTLYKQLGVEQGDDPAAVQNAFKALSAQIFIDAGTVGEIPSGESVTNGEYVDWIYQNVLGRAADEAGRAYWIAQLDNGSIDRAELVGIVIASAYDDERDGAYLTNRTTVALEFAKFENSNPQILGNLEFNAAQVLDGVNEDPASIDAALAKLSSATGGGQSFFLTPGVDKLVGTAGDDVFNALPVNPATGEPSQTLGAFDSIDGGAGRDTLNIYSGAATDNVLPANVSIKNIEVINLFNTATQEFNTGGGQLDASKFTGVQELWQHGAAVDVANLADTTAAGFKNLEGDTTVDVSAAEAATTVAVIVDGVDGDISLDVNAGKATTVVADFSNVEGEADLDIDSDTVIGVEASFTNVEYADVSLEGKALDNVAIELSNVENADIYAGGEKVSSVLVTGELAAVEEGEEENEIELYVETDVQTLTVTTQVNTYLDVDAYSEGSKLDTVDASTSTGDIFFVAEGNVKNVSTGAGDDTIIVDRAGATTVSSGAGDDTIVFDRTLVSGDRVNGGEGFDTLVLNTQARLVSAGEYNILKAGVTNIDNLVFDNAVDVDASRLSSFSQLTFVGDDGVDEDTAAVSTVTKASATQTLVTEQDLVVTAAGYVEGSAFGGAVSIEVAEGAEADILANASVVNLSLEDSAARLGGDFEVANVDLVTNWPEEGDDDSEFEPSYFVLLSADAENLTTLTVSGSGSVIVFNGFSTGEEGDLDDAVLAPSALVTIDVSGLDEQSAFQYLSANAEEETITLGAGYSQVGLANSTVGAMDSVSGLKLMDFDAAEDDDAEETPFDMLVVGYVDTEAGDGFDAFVQLSSFEVTTVSDTDDLGLALVEVAAKEGDQFVFTFGGDTYVYANLGEATLDDSDVLVKIVGQVDLNDLVATLNQVEV
ncbi:DUF4214 domain-containing protein [Achromobacter sp. GG226]|uniref:DUF4214 domain-containing protein n=1 Tax=Verticiella alkaliphila TaxID=2779529 RepID=UPI001C0B4EAA|nr:DUF4214 domain-containing protein [Verticiella sp. GG226]MBU4611583.1 DUF4214 domain-containing protein [Verticiella sp. GG226]